MSEYLPLLLKKKTIIPSGFFQGDPVTLVDCLREKRRMAILGSVQMRHECDGG